MPHETTQAAPTQPKRAFWRVYRPLSCLISSLFILILLTPGSAMAWNGAGHRIVATIAWEKMSPTGRQSLARLLRQHPDFAHWASMAGKGMNVDHTAFVEASTWADEIRRDPRFHHRHESPTPTLPGFPDMRRNSPWHYADALDTREQDNVYTALSDLTEQLSNPQTAPSHRAYALVWIIHLVADAHQPLHNGFRADRGGNEFALIRNAQSLRTDNLHSFWDALPGPANLRGTPLLHTVEALMAEHRNLAEGPIDFSRWFHENLKISQQAGYPEQNPPAALTEQFVRRAQIIANRQLVLAGIRLARLIENSLGIAAKNSSPPIRTPFHVERRTD